MLSLLLLLGRKHLIVSLPLCVTFVIDTQAALLHYIHVERPTLTHLVQLCCETDVQHLFSVIKYVSYTISNTCVNYIDCLARTAENKTPIQKQIELNSILLACTRRMDELIENAFALHLSLSVHISVSLALLIPPLGYLLAPIRLLILVNSSCCWALPGNWLVTMAGD